MTRPDKRSSWPWRNCHCHGGLESNSRGEPPTQDQYSGLVLTEIWAGCLETGEGRWSGRGRGEAELLQPRRSVLGLALALGFPVGFLEPYPGCALAGESGRPGPRLLDPAEAAAVEQAFRAAASERKVGHNDDDDDHGCVAGGAEKCKGGQARAGVVQGQRARLGTLHGGSRAEKGLLCMFVFSI